MLGQMGSDNWSYIELISVWQMLQSSQLKKRFLIVIYTFMIFAAKNPKNAS